MSLGLSQILSIGATALSSIMDKNQENTGSVYGSASEVRSRIDFNRFKRDSLAPQEAGEVKANEAISYAELNRIWDTILPNAYKELAERVEQPAFSRRKDT